MHKRTHVIMSILLLFLLSWTSGCVDIFQDFTTEQITYEKHPTTIAYHITYGYRLYLNGTGTSKLHYREDLPEVLRGTIQNITLHNQLHATIKTQAENEMIFWNETFQDTQHLFLGISADVLCESMMITDLRGSNALSLNEIQTTQSHLIEKYCSIQGNDTKTLIDPRSPQIIQTATSVKHASNTNNTFQLAQELFKWVKTHTQYQYHVYDQHIQSCIETFTKQTGDCDDLSFLYISLCRALSIPARFIRGYLITDQNNIQELIPHVWVEIYVGNNLGNDGWIPVECAGTGDIESEIHQNFGVEDAHHLRLFIDNGSNTSMQLYTNHISIEYGPELTIEIQNQSDIINYDIIASKKLCIMENKERNYC